MGCWSPQVTADPQGRHSTARARGEGLLSLSGLIFFYLFPGPHKGKFQGPVGPCVPTRTGALPASSVCLRVLGGEGGGQEGKQEEGHGCLTQRVSPPHYTGCVPRTEGRAGVRPGPGAGNHGTPNEDPRGDAHRLPWAGCRHSRGAQAQATAGVVRGPETALGWGAGWHPEGLLGEEEHVENPACVTVYGARVHACACVHVCVCVSTCFHVCATGRRARPGRDPEPGPCDRRMPVAAFKGDPSAQQEAAG